MSVKVSSERGDAVENAYLKAPVNDLGRRVSKLTEECQSKPGWGGGIEWVRICTRQGHANILDKRSNFLEKK